jgi:hypothetical protein
VAIPILTFAQLSGISAAVNPPAMADSSAVMDGFICACTDAGHEGIYFVESGGKFYFIAPFH